MKGHVTMPLVQEPKRTGRAWVRGELVPLVVLLAAAVGLRVWHLCHTEVAARDSIGFIRYAWQLHQQPWLDVVAHGEQHPGYPAAVLLTSLVVRPCVSGPESLTMQLSAQLASSVAGVLLVLPMFYLGRELFNRSVGFGASLLFQCLPASGRVLADGLSEATFLLFAVTALLFAVRALRGNAARWFVLSGLFGGLAYLTRPEGALIVAATGLVLLGMQAVTGWRRPVRPFLRCGASLVLAALFVGSPFVLITGHLTVKPTGKDILKKWAESGQLPEAAMTSPGQPLLASTLGAWWYDDDGEVGKYERLGWGLQALVHEAIKGTYYVGWLLALLGLWWCRNRLRIEPGAWVVLLVGAALGLVLWRVAAVVGYVSDRHALLLILCSTFWTVAGLRELPARFAVLAQWLAERVQVCRFLLVTSNLRWLGWAPMVLLLMLVGLALPRTLQPLHSNRAGFRDAGLWLAEHMDPNDEIRDPYCWTHYYAGKVFLEGTTPPVPPGYRAVEYLVFESSGNDHPNLKLHKEIEQRKEEGEVVYQWSGRRRKDRCEVIVYAVRRDMH
jgi:hypothetical protein